MIKFESVGSIFKELKPFIHSTDVGQEYLEFDDYLGLYYDIAAKVCPSSILEIGVRFGYTGLAMLLGCGGKATYVGFDNESYGEVEPNSYALKQLKQVCKLVVHVFTLDTQATKELPVPAGTKIDLIHVDGCHTPKAVLHDLSLVSKYVHSGTYIIVDDTNHHGVTEIGDVTRRWAEEHGYEWVEFLEHCGRIVLKKKNGHHHVRLTPISRQKEKDATQEREKREGSGREHQGTEKVRPSTKAGGGDSDEQGGEKQEEGIKEEDSQKEN
jgi:predicted O-methyltransferase YrrM